MAGKKIFLDNPGQYLDRTTKANMRNVKRTYIDNDLDFFGLVVCDKTGTGLGKSSFAQQLCAYMDILNWGIENRRFHTGRIFFNETDYRMEESYLLPRDSFEFDEPDAFFSLTATSRSQRRLKLKVIHIRQQRYFFMLCADSIFSVASWVRPGAETRINIIFRIVKRGVVLVYSGKTGTMQKIKLDTRKRKVIWPAADQIIYFKRIPKKSPWWKDYIKRKNAYLKQSDDNPRAVKLMKKHEKKLRETLTLSNIADIQKVHKSTVKRWYMAGYFGKRGVFKDASGIIRIKMRAYKAGMKRVLRAKNKEMFRRGKRGKDKKKRKVQKRAKSRKRPKRKIKKKKKRPLRKKKRKVVKRGRKKKR